MARFVTTTRFVTKVTKRAAMPARFVTNEEVTNRAGIAAFFSPSLISLMVYVDVKHYVYFTYLFSLTWILVHVTLYLSLETVTFNHNSFQRWKLPDDA